MSEITLIGLDLAKNVFQLQGADQSRKAVLRKKLRRSGSAVSFNAPTLRRRHGGLWRCAFWGQ